jgi:hypothetical protein
MTQTPWTPEELDALGISPNRIGGSDQLGPGEEVAQGLPRVSHLALAALMAAKFAETMLRQVNAATSRSAGIEMAILQLPGAQGAAPRTIISLTDEDRSPVEVRWLRPAPGKQLVDEFDKGTVYLEPEQGDGLVALRTSGAGLLLRVGDGTIDLAHVRSPIDMQLAACRDAWVSELARRHLATRGPLRHLLASGVLIRLREDFDRAATREIVDRLLSGQPDERVGWAHAWARGLSQSQREDLGELACKVAAVLGRDLSSLQPGDATETGWRERLVPVLHGRDDFEGVRVLLAEAGVGEPLAREIDRRGIDLMRALPGDALPLRDERLRRVRSIDPAAWWAGSVQAEDDEA